MALILAIDPGPLKSAYCKYDTDEQVPESFGIEYNELINTHFNLRYSFNLRYDVVIERIASYGMPVGETVFDTCIWIGRFIESAINSGCSTELILRKDIKLHLCNSPRANDASIRQALIDRFGPPGTKKKPGILYGCKKDMWAALAVAVTYADTSKSHK